MDVEGGAPASLQGPKHEKSFCIVVGMTLRIKKVPGLMTQMVRKTGDDVISGASGHPKVRIINAHNMVKRHINLKVIGRRINFQYFSSPVFLTIWVMSPGTF